MIVFLLELFQKNTEVWWKLRQIKHWVSQHYLSLNHPLCSVTGYILLVHLVFATNGAAETLVLDTLSTSHFQSRLGLLDIIPYKSQKWFSIPPFYPVPTSYSVFNFLLHPFLLYIPRLDKYVSWYSCTWILGLHVFILVWCYT